MFLQYYNSLTSPSQNISAQYFHDYSFNETILKDIQGFWGGTFTSARDASQTPTERKHRKHLGRFYSICIYISTFTQECNARKVNCSCVYSAYILKPVLSGRNLKTRIDASVFVQYPRRLKALNLNNFDNSHNSSL